MRAYLSGTPECKFGLNDRLLLDPGESSSGGRGNDSGLGTSRATRAAAGSVTLEDCQFHQCVKLGRFDADRIISFVPPDGEFELMRYRATENVNLPFKVHPIVREIGTTKVEYSVAIKANYSSKLFATNVVIRIPTPLNTAKTTERTSQGRAKYEPEQNNIVWKIARFSGQSEFVLNAEATLTSMTHQKAWSRPPLSLSFSLLMFTSSGLLVRYLKVFEKGNYSSVKWVRYMTRAGSYEIRYVVDSGIWGSFTDVALGSDYSGMVVSDLVLGLPKGLMGMLISMDLGPAFVLFILLCAAQWVSGVWWSAHTYWVFQKLPISFFVSFFTSQHT